MSNPSREQLGERLSSYLDGELDEQQTRLIERTLREDEAARRLLDELRQTAAAMSSLPRHAAPSCIHEQIQLQLERGELLGDLPSSTPRSMARGAPRLRRLSLAAMLALTIGAGVWIASDRWRQDEVVRKDVLALARTKQPLEPSPTEMDRRDAPRNRKTMNRRAARRRVAEPAIEGATFAAGSIEVMTHRFDKEPFRLRITTRDEQERDAVMRKLTAKLRHWNVADLSLSSNRASRSFGRKDGYFLRGRPGVNFDSSQDKQVLVRATPRMLGALVDEYGKSADTASEVVLQAGPVVFRGWDDTRRVLRQLEDPARGGWTRNVVAAASDPSRPARRPGRSFDQDSRSLDGAQAVDADVSTLALLESLFRSIGLNASRESVSAEPSDVADAGTGSSRSADRRLQGGSKDEGFGTAGPAQPNRKRVETRADATSKVRGVPSAPEITPLPEKAGAARVDAGAAKPATLHTEDQKSTTVANAGLQLEKRPSLVERRLRDLSKFADQPVASRRVRTGEPGVQEGADVNPSEIASGPIRPDRGEGRLVTLVIEVRIDKPKLSEGTRVGQPARRSGQRAAVKPKPPSSKSPSE